MRSDGAAVTPLPNDENVSPGEHGWENIII
jgi:hypothetical protein